MFYDGIYKSTVLYAGHNCFLLHRLSNINLKVNIQVITSLYEL